jgi:nitroimidazol reductase NimA-like FMN-containing flavoprotein (pyridoxamine 5'-phosphate oxidase superfamily)
MNPHEIAEALDQPGAQDLLTSATLLRLAYDGPDGFPRVVPTGFLWSEGRIVVCTAATAPKVRALAARPRVAVTIDDGDTPAQARSLLVRGVATVELVDGVAAEYIEAARKAMAPEQVAEFERAVAAVYDRMARISIEPAWARFFDFGAGRLPAFLAKLAGGA